MRVELVGGPHCGATVDIPSIGTPHNIWTPGQPRGLGSTVRMDYTHAPARSSDVAYTWDRHLDRYTYSGPYEVA